MDKDRLNLLRILPRMRHEPCGQMVAVYRSKESGEIRFKSHSPCDSATAEIPNDWKRPEPRHRKKRNTE